MSRSRPIPPTPAAPPPITEAEWQEQVVQLAAMLGWRTMHVRRAIGRRAGGRGWQTSTSVNGWPDLTLWSERQGRLVFAELKSDAGRCTPEQDAVISSLRHAGQDVHVWRPRDLDAVAAVLRGDDPARASA